VNVLYLGTYSPEALQNDHDYARWFERGGANVVRFDPEAAYLRGGMVGAELALLEALRAHRVDVLVYALGLEFDYRPAFFRGLPEHLLTVLVLGDDEHYFDMSHRYYAQAFDLVLTLNPLVQRYAHYGIEAWPIPMGYDSMIFRPTQQQSKTIDVSFVGAMRGKVGRAEYARALAGADVDFRAFGSGTPGGMVSRDRVIEIFRQSRINLNFTGVALTTPLDARLGINRRTRQMKGRPFMVALCGSFVLSEYAPGMEHFFEIGKELDVFDSQAEMIEKIRYYLAHDDLREAIADAGYRRAIEHYELAKVAGWIVPGLDRRLAGPRRRVAPIYIDRLFWRCFGAWRFKYLVLFALTGRPWLWLRELGLLVRSGCDWHAAPWFAWLGLHVGGRLCPLGSVIASGAQRVRNGFRR
jgi:spore maturation protein CgeB